MEATDRTTLEQENARLREQLAERDLVIARLERRIASLGKGVRPPDPRFEQQAEAIRIAVGDDELLIKRAGMSGLENSEETGLAPEPEEGAVDP